jgi:feruloyl esterase
MVILALTAGAVATFAGERAPSQDIFAADATTCASLDGRTVGPGRIVAATFVYPSYVTEQIGSPNSATVVVPFCRLEGVIDIAPHSHSVFEVWLPVRTNWNGRFLGIGSGDSYGAISNLRLAAGVMRGYASVATDNGHRSPGPHDDNQWALGEPERIIDFAYRAHHLATIAGKEAARSYYGRVPNRSYYFGCSQGGHHGMMEVERFPEDYDGVVAGAPVYSWTSEMTFQAWGVRAVTETPRSALQVSHLQALSAAVGKACSDANGLVMDPRRCAFDPAQLHCPGDSSGPNCLTSEQVAAVMKIYEGPRTSDGRSLSPGFARGSERLWDTFFGNAKADGSAGGGSWFGVYRYMVFDDRRWTLPQMDFDRDPALAKNRLASILDPDNPDLDAFARRGGKLLVYHGWSDQEVPPEVSLAYHDAVVARSSKARTDSYMRLFMVPGMAHCTTPPPGPNLQLKPESAQGAAITAQNDALMAVQEWVENGRAPSELIVRLQDEKRDLTTRTVLACASPAAAHYRGSGNPLDAANWKCALNQR